MRIVRRAHEIQGGVLGAHSTNDTVLLNLQAQTVDYSIDGRRLAVVCAWNGRQEVGVDGRRIVVDDDTWLAVPAGMATVRIRVAQYSAQSAAQSSSQSSIHGSIHGSMQGAQALTILFRPGMPEEVLEALVTADDRMLEIGDIHASPGSPFMPHLQVHDHSVTPVLWFIRRHCEMGLEDPLWYEEQLAFLLERMLMRHRHVVARARVIPVRRAATRREIVRRICLATDFIHSNYARPLMLCDMARAAFLSRHHFLRLFKYLQNATPHEYLQRKRTSVAVRLLRTTRLQVEDIVKEVGFDSRSTLFRALRRFHGMTPRECRQVAEVPVFMGDESRKVTDYRLHATGPEKNNPGQFVGAEMAALR